MQNATLYFSECEHNGDLDAYLDDIRSSGGVITGKKLNYEAEIATVDILIEKDFVEKFRKTRAFESSNLAD